MMIEQSYRMPERYIWVCLNVLLFLSGLAMGCGGGGGGPAVSTQSGKAQDYVNLVFRILNYLPPDYSNSFESAIIGYVNDQINKVFGGDMRVSGYASGETGSPISCPADLSCNFNSSCRWRNVRDEDLTYYMGQGKADVDNFEILTGTRDLPDSPYVLAAGNQGSNAAYLVSDTIPNQPGEGVVEFKYWLTPLIELRVCTRTPGNTNQLRFCSSPFTSASKAGPFTVKIPGPIKDPFELLFEVSHFVVDPGGIGIIDDIVYRSTLCSPTKQTVRSESLDSKTFDDGLCKSVACDFNQKKPCRYEYVAHPGEKPWSTRTGPVGNPLTGIRRDRFGNSDFSDGYLVAEGVSASGQDIFVAQSGPFHVSEVTTLKFYRWQGSANTRLKVCISDPSYCIRTFNNITRDWVLTSVDINPRDLPSDHSQILFVAEGLTQNHYIGIDEIQISGSKCK